MVEASSKLRKLILSSWRRVAAEMGSGIDQACNGEGSGKYYLTCEKVSETAGERTQLIGNEMIIG